VAPELIAIKPSSERDPDGSKLSYVLCAHLALERASLNRSAMVHLMAALSVPVGFVAVWPELLSPEERRLVILSWGLSTVAAVTAKIREWRWRWRRDSQAAEIREDLPAGQ
jgi:hypothetical protein